MPLVVAAVGAFGTFVSSSQGQKSAEIRADADRQIKLLEIFSTKIASSDERERILGLRILKALVDNDLVEKLAKAVSATESEPGNVKKVAEEVAAQASIEGFWILRRENQPPGHEVNWLKIAFDETGLKVFGNKWQGKGTFTGKKGYYEWKFDDGTTGRTDISLDDTGVLHGTVRSTAKGWQNWDYWATLRIE